MKKLIIPVQESKIPVGLRKTIKESGIPMLVHTPYDPNTEWDGSGFAIVPDLDQSFVKYGVVPIPSLRISYLDSNGNFEYIAGVMLSYGSPNNQKDFTTAIEISQAKDPARHFIENMIAETILKEIEALYREMDWQYNTKWQTHVVNELINPIRNLSSHENVNIIREFTEEVYELCLTGFIRFVFDRKYQGTVLNISK